MRKKYIVRLTAEERETCHETIRRLKGSSERVRRAQILLKTDADGPAWTDRKIAEAFSCRTKTVENIRQNFVEGGAGAGAEAAGDAAEAEDSRRRGGGQGHCLASGRSSERVRQLVVAVAGRWWNWGSWIP